MALEVKPDTVMVPVKQYKVDLTWNDILTPLAQAASAQTTQATLAAGDAPHPELARHIDKLSELAAQLKDTVDEINRLNPALLSRGAKPR